MAEIARNFIVLATLILAPAAAFSQSNALDAQIEGTVLDQVRSTIPDATVTATNTGTGSARTVKADQNGVYRIPLLPLGTYRINADAPGFKRFVREGITLATGQSATIDLQLEAGQIEETVTVAGDAPVADPGNTDLSRVITSREVSDLPLPTRNPFNFVIIQANVTGRPNRGFNFPQVNVNGFARRVNYLLDGNTNTRGDRAGTRLLQVSETYVNEIQLLTNGFAPEFGNTPGMIVNMVTPSGTNDLRGSVSYFFRRPSFYSRPFFFSAPQLPDNVTNNIAASVGGPVVRDRWHFYFGYEYVNRDDSTRANRQVTISETHKAALIAEGVPASVFVPAIPSQEYGAHYIFRSDLRLNANNRLITRFIHSDLGTRNNINGDFNTLERSVDLEAKDHALGAQLVSYSGNVMNEFRFQFVRAVGENVRNAMSGTAPSVTITNVANFGAPLDADTIEITKVTQLQNNVSTTRGAHVIKLGGGISATRNYNRGSTTSVYTFRTREAYIAARRGDAPFGYDRYQQSFGEPFTLLTAANWNLFLQDDWKATRRLKLSYGMRYDLYVVPRADPSSPFPFSRKFAQDRNNVSPRFGLVYALKEGGRPLVLRIGAGMYYEPVWFSMYDRANRNNGTRFFDLAFCGDDGGNCPRAASAPAFPATFLGLPPPVAQNIVTVSPDFENMYAVHSNVQIEQAITSDLSIALGYVHSGGRHIPVYRSINRVGVVRSLADGRPVFGETRLDPRFDQIQMAESAGVSRYDALTLQLNRRYARGLQLSANYTFSRAVDDAPEQNVTYSRIAGVTNTSLVLSDPTNRSLDKGFSYGDQRHTFVMSLVARPTFSFRSKTLSYLLSNNQFGIIASANSGERFSILAGEGSNLAGLDLNNDGISTADRPVGVKRNSGKTPRQFNLDLRYSRLFSFAERYRVELLGEIQNLFNINSIIGYSNVRVQTDPTTGEMIGPVPDFRTRNASFALESRQLQLGIKFIF